jgi:selenocysteine-specific elongation factor
MARHLILGTAGHIDHGKTSLVKALTGIDCDRLPEEKARGITIDIGFAHLDLGDFRLGIVDVPGHERFIRNMLAGATGMDLCCLVIAADDGVMPQTREHLEILQYLGLQHGVLVLTKIDLVDTLTREVVALEVRQLVRGTFLENAPLVATSAYTGEGLAELKAALAAECHRYSASRGYDWFRLAIDRVFVVQGHGTVVTGTVSSGEVQVGAEVEWLPCGQRVRIRGLQNHDQAVPAVQRGMRAAINLAQVRHEDIRRGHELATPGVLRPSRVLTARLRVSPGLARPVRHRSQARLHLGTAEVMTQVALLDADELRPDCSGLVQLFVKEPVTAIWGQPYILRSPSAEQTWGGGQILQPVAGKIRRRHLEIIERVECLGSDSKVERVRQVAWFAGYSGVTTFDVMRDAGLSGSQAQELLNELTASGHLVTLRVGGHRSISLAAELLAELEERILNQLRQCHEMSPLLALVDRSKLQAQFAYIGDDELVVAAVDRLIARGLLVGDARRVALADHKPRLSQAQRKLKEKIITAYREAGFQPPAAASFASQAGGHASALKDLFDVCVGEGLLVHLGDEIYLHSEHEEELRRRVLERLSSGTGLTIAELRDLLGTSRKFAVPICEYLDRIGITRRVGDLRFANTEAADNFLYSGQTKSIK